MSGSQMQRRNPEMVRILSADLQPRYEPNFAWKSACSQFQGLTGLRGFWPMSSSDESGNAYDLSCQGRTLDQPAEIGQYGYTNLIFWYENFAGEGCGYLRRLDEAGLDISGTETYIVPEFRGLTLGGWFRADELAGTQGLITKWVSDGEVIRSYALYFSGNSACFSVSQNCTDFETVTSSVVAQNGLWYFIAGRFIPETTLDVYVYDQKDTESTALAFICDSDVDFCITSFHGGSNCFDGRTSLCFLCAAALSDAIINSLYQQSRAMFGVR